MAWVALAPLLVSLTRHPPVPSRRAFALGLVSGAVGFAATLYWIPDVMVTYGGLHRVPAVVIGLLLVAYLALFPAAFAVAQARLGQALGPAALLLAPAVWVTTELGRMYLLSGFPWELLGYSQTPVLPVAQLASVLGVHGVSGLVVLVNAALVLSVAGRGRLRVAGCAAAGACLVAVIGWGSWRVERSALLAEGEPLTVALLQGNVPQDEKWDFGREQEILDRYVAMSRDAARQGAQLIIWPESATPFSYEAHAAGQAAIRRLARETGTHLLFGSDQVVPASPPRLYNAAFLVAPSGETAGVYRKVHLVPFGEYVPARALLFFVRPLVEAVSDFSPGEDVVALPVGTHGTSAAICYEVIYPGLVDRFVDRGSHLLATITNDAWFGTSSAPAQHFQQAAMRAIEQGRFLVRAANTGISGVVDPYGRVLERTALFEEALVVAEVRWLDDRTVYGRIGDLFAWFCVAATVGALAAVRATGAQRKKVAEARRTQKAQRERSKR